MSDEKNITLKDLIKLGPEYMRIQDLDTPTPWLYATKEFTVKIDGDQETLERPYRVTNLVISLSARWDEPQPRSIQFARYGNTDMLMCLLAHKPETLRVCYYHDNQSSNMKVNDLHMETITVIGTRGRREHQITFNTPRTTAGGSIYDFMADLVRGSPQ